MGLVFFENLPAYQYGIWKMEESVEELSSILPNIPCSFSAKKRRLEFYAVRCLIKQMGINPCLIQYKASGEPYIENSTTQLSISHTQEYVAVMISEQNKHIGIDIEMFSERIFRITGKFVHADEQKAIEQYATSHEELQKAFYLHWCGKEASYKAAHKERIDFLKDIRIYELHNLHESGHFKARIQDLSVEAIYRITDDYTLVYCYAP